MAIDFKNTQEYMGGPYRGFRAKNNRVNHMGFDKRDWLRDKVLGSETDKTVVTVLVLFAFWYSINALMCVWV